MKKIIKLILVSAILTTCKSYDASKISVKKEPIAPKLLTLNKKIEDMANATVLTSEDRMKLFSKEVEENLTDPYGDKYGSIVMKQNMITQKPRMFWPGAILLSIPTLLGAPMARPLEEIEVEFRIMDSQNRLIGKYSAIGRASNPIAMYWGYSSMNAWRKTYVDAINKAFDQIRPQILADANRLNQKLKESGKVN
jgi:hypothetical protein